MTGDPISNRRLREAFAATAREQAPTPECPPAETLWNAVQGTLDPTGLRRVLAHVAGCALCTESWRLAREIADDEADGQRTGSAPDTPDQPSGWVGWASAAAAALAFMTFGLTYDGGSPGAAIARQVDRGTESLELIAPREPASLSDCRPRWTAFADAAYDVHVLNERFELLAEENGLITPDFLVPPNLLPQQPSPVDLRIYIAVKRGLEGVVAERTFDFQCQAP